MKVRVVRSIEDREQNHTQHANPAGKNAKYRRNLLKLGLVARETTGMAEPAFGKEGHVQGDGSNGTSGDKQWL